MSTKFIQGNRQEGEKLRCTFAHCVWADMLQCLCAPQCAGTLRVLACKVLVVVLLGT